MSLLESAIYTAVRAHAGQIDEDGMPHIVHSMEVMAAVRKAYEERPVVGYTLEELMAAAILHDVAEDSIDHGVHPVSLDDIRKMFGDKIADIVDSVTRRGKGDTKEFYRDFVYRAKANPGGRLLKVADLLHNMSRTHKISEKKAKWRKKLEYKYTVAERVLNDVTEPTWEGASYEVEYYDLPHSNLRGARFYIADPNGKRIEISKEEADRVQISFRISN